MSRCGAVGTLTFAMTLGVTALSNVAATAADAKYPDLEGAWDHLFRPLWSADEPSNKPPLTPEYMKVFEANQANMAAGGLGAVPSAACVPYGMPMMMNAYDPLEIIVTPKVTYVLTSNPNDSYRRIYTDGRAWPAEIEPTFAGYSIGRWIDQDGDGTYDVLEVETRALRAPHTYDGSGTPFHSDNEAFITERIYLDKTDKDHLHDDITSHDHALTHPWTKNRVYQRTRDWAWQSAACSADNLHVRIGQEDYFLSPDGKLMPTRKGQPAPDLTYFNPLKK
jgi:hypothetical protein